MMWVLWGFGAGMTFVYLLGEYSDRVPYAERRPVTFGDIALDVLRAALWPWLVFAAILRKLDV